MKRATLPFAAALAIVGGIALAQGAEDPMAQLRACSLMERADRLECLDKLSRAIAPPARPAPKADGWPISQTSSPVDYAPIATATVESREVASGSTMQLSIRCRGGRTELAVAGPIISGRGEDYVVSYRVNGGEPVQIAAAMPAFGAGVAFKGNAVPLIQSLPSEGELAVHLSPRVGTAQDGIFSLAGLEMVRAKVATACKWPHAIAKPNDR
jgi:hypothetical protein